MTFSLKIAFAASLTLSNRKMGIACPPWCAERPMPPCPEVTTEELSSGTRIMERPSRFQKLGRTGPGVDLAPGTALTSSEGTLTVAAPLVNVKGTPRT